MRMFSTRIFYFLMLIPALFASCQKDENVKNLKAETALQADSSLQLSSTSSPGNYLASKGTLKIRIQDSTYIFDAEQDSIAFVNINISGEEYYGVTAINKAHTVSFGISSSAVPIAEMTSYVSGCQFLLRTPGKKGLEYTLIRNAPREQDFGSIVIEKYNQDTILAKGTFHTFLAKDTKLNTPFYVAEGSFDLKVK